jgi:hypothetical protein
LRNVEENRGKLKKVQRVRTCLSGRHERWRKVVKKNQFIFYSGGVKEEETGRT